MKSNRSLRVLLWSMLVTAILPVGAKLSAPKAVQSAKGYSITPPAGWTMHQNGIMGADMFVAAPPAKGYAANINVVIVPAAPGETLEKDAVKIPQMMPRVLSGYKKLSHSYGTLGGLRALTITANHKMGTPPRLLWMKQVLVLRKGQAYVFTCTALHENHADYRGAFETALKSVRWTN